MADVAQRPDGGSTTTPARWDPFRELEDVRARMNRLFGDMLAAPGLPMTAAAWTPPVDVEETDDAWIVEADVPGVMKEDVNVDVQDRELVIHGEIKERERTGMMRRRTRRTGEFDYRVTLPHDVDADNIDANLDGGVLRVRIPKTARAQSKHVEVHSAS